MKKHDDTQYWFRAKRYGWGWGLPLNRKGWLVFGAFFAIWAIGLAWLTTIAGSQDTFSTELSTFLVVMALDVAGLLYFSFKYGEPPKWQWGKKHGK